MKKLMALVASLVFAALAVGCSSDDNANTVGNANKPANSNVAVVTNTNTTANTTANTKVSPGKTNGNANNANSNKNANKKK